MSEPPSPDDAKPSTARSRFKVKGAGKKAAHLTSREYLPMGMMLSFWAVVALGVGHADAARLLAATVLMRAPLMLSQMSTIGAVRRRMGVAGDIFGKAVRLAALVQVGVLAALVTETLFLAWLLNLAGQPLLAQMLLVVAIGYPARLYRSVDPRASSKHFRLYTNGSSLMGAVVVLLLGGGPLSFALAYGLRDWLATTAILLFGPSRGPAKETTSEPLTFFEIARGSVVTARRMLTYRLTKNVLAVFGPFGNFAARTSRGLNLHSRFEPYMPHRRGGFVAFALVAAAIAVGLTLRSGKPLALIAGAGAIQLCALGLNVLLWWQYLPRRDDPTLVVGEEEDD